MTTWAARAYSAIMLFKLDPVTNGQILRFGLFFSSPQNWNFLLERRPNSRRNTCNGEVLLVDLFFPSDYTDLSRPSVSYELSKVPLFLWKRAVNLKVD